jgi:hypothetical protein
MIIWRMREASRMEIDLCEAIAPPTRHLLKERLIFPLGTRVQKRQAESGLLTNLVLFLTVLRTRGRF